MNLTGENLSSITARTLINLVLKMRGVSATEIAKMVGVQTLAFDIPGFAKKGDIVCGVDG